MPQCIHIKDDGLQCRASAILESQYCRYHGGLNLKGIAHPNFKSGKYSIYLPDKLVAKYEDARADIDLLSLRDELALLDARIGDILEKIRDKQTVDLWGSLSIELDSLEDSYMANDQVQIGNEIAGIRDLIKKGVEAEKGWAEIYTVVEGRRRVAETERKRLVEMNQMISSERAMVLLASILDVIKRNVKDGQTLSRIANEIRQLASRSVSGVSGPTDFDGGSENSDGAGRMDPEVLLRT